MKALPYLHQLRSHRKRVSTTVLLSGLILGGAAILTSCTSTTAYWTEESNIVARSYVELTEGEHRKLITHRNDNAALAVLEINEEGELASDPQLKNILDRLEKGAGAEKLSTVLVYAHGWHHDASPEQGRGKDLGEFDTLIYRTREITKKPVMGVYLGWRGELIRFPAINQFTLDNRREVARTIGTSPKVNEALAGIIQSSRRANPHCKVVFIGHSLGGCLMERMAHRMITADAIKLDETKLPDLFLLINNAETAPESAPLIAEINNHPGVLKQLQGDRLLSPWVISITSKGDWPNRIANPLNGILHGRFSDSTSGFKKGLITHKTIPNEQAQWRKTDQHKEEARILEVIRRDYLEPAFFVPPSNPTSGPVQHGLHPITSRSKAVGYWNFQIPKETVSNHNDIHNVNALGVALSMLHMADRKNNPIAENQNLPDHFANHPDPASYLERLSLPRKLENIVRLQKQSLKIRGENQIGDSHTNLGRQLMHGPAYRLPYNERNIKTLLDDLTKTCSNPSIEPKKIEGVRTREDFRRRYAICVFDILKYSHLDQDAWSPANRDLLNKMFSEIPALKECAERCNPGENGAKVKFTAFLNTWLLKENQLHPSKN